MSFKIKKIEGLYKEKLQDLFSQNKLSSVEVFFYPYSQIKHTLRIRNGRLIVRIADSFKDAPFEIQEALASILVAKLLKKAIPDCKRKIYSKFVAELENPQKYTKLKPAKGKFHNLEEIFDKLNKKYFQNKLSKPILGWSLKKSSRKLGGYDFVNKVLVINSALDDSKVPDYVVEMIMYHEMLHVKHSYEKRKSGRKCFHTTVFREEEKKFEFFEDAQDWLIKFWNERKTQKS